MIFRFPCLWHDYEPAFIEAEFSDIPGTLEFRVKWADGFTMLATRMPVTWTSRNEIRCESEWGPALFQIDLERKALRLRHFPFQITIPDEWHEVTG